MSSCLKDSVNPSSKTISLHSEDLTGFSLKPREAILHPKNFQIVIEGSKLSFPDTTKLLYYVNKTTANIWLCILPTVAFDILQTVYRENHPSFSRCYKIVIYSWYIQGLTRLVKEFIRYCFQCLQLQTRRHCSYGSLQPINLCQYPSLY